MVGKLIAQVIAAGIIVTAYGVYWIGLEAVHGTVVANAVRLASTGTTYSHCNQWLAEVRVILNWTEELKQLAKSGNQP
jgi:hypothetical protein